jgi:hypothetical protein
VMRISSSIRVLKFKLLSFPRFMIPDAIVLLSFLPFKVIFIVIIGITSFYNTVCFSKSTSPWFIFNENLAGAIRESPSVTIFYNVFFGSNLNLTVAIVKEQLEDISRFDHLKNVTIKFVVIGNDVFDPKCNNRICETIKRDATGDEKLTLQFLHNHCVKHPEQQVIYLHTKGSYHSKPENNLFRRLLTKSAVSKDCILQHKNKIGDTSLDCNVCSARFSPYPHWHSPGNMWRAECDYISKLIPPKDFPRKMKEVIESAREQTNKIIRSKNSWKFGASRFSAEHWVHTHPDVKPCDVYTGAFVWNYDNLWQSSLERVQDLHCLKAPRFSKEKYFKPWLGIHDNFYFSTIEYRLFELEILYGHVPPNGSWVWDFYSTN